MKEDEIKNIIENLLNDINNEQQNTQKTNYNNILADFSNIEEKHNELPIAEKNQIMIQLIEKINKLSETILLQDTLIELYKHFIKEKQCHCNKCCKKE